MGLFVFAILVGSRNIGRIDDQAFIAILLQLPTEGMSEGFAFVGETKILAGIPFVQVMHEMHKSGSDTGIAEEKSFIYHSHLPAHFMDIQSHAKRLVGECGGTCYLNSRLHHSRSFYLMI
jgi:hypothetical protein